MCVIVAMPPNVRLDEERLRNCYDNNSEGWGIMFNAPSNGAPAVWTAKAVSNFDAFMEAFQSVPLDATVGVHFRIKTHGPVNVENCHPFRINHGLFMMHNGILRVPTPDNRFSDTWHFVNNDLKSIIGEDVTCEDLDNSELFKSIEDFSAGSKLFFLDKHGKSLATHHKAWHELKVGDGHVFLSNSHSHISRQSYTYGYSYQYSHNYRSPASTTPTTTKESCSVTTLPKDIPPAKQYASETASLPLNTSTIKIPSLKELLETKDGLSKVPLTQYPTLRDFFEATDEVQEKFAKEFPESIVFLMYELLFTTLKEEKILASFAKKRLKFLLGKKRETKEPRKDVVNA